MGSRTDEFRRCKRCRCWFGFLNKDRMCVNCAHQVELLRFRAVQTKVKAATKK
jgi:hypothetical protein